jgi:hypothetical protein
VQHGHVVGIDHVFEMLQPVAGNDGWSAAADGRIIRLDEFVIVHLFEAFVARQRRLLLGRSQIGEDQAIAFLQGIPGLPYLVLEQTARGFAGLFEAMAFDVELPAVVAAADAVFLDLAVIERGAAMAAAGVQQADAGVPVAKQHQILAEHADFSGDIGGVGDEADRVPIAAEQFAHRRAPADRGQLGARRGRLHGVAGPEIAIPLGNVHAVSSRRGFGAAVV